MRLGWTSRVAVAAIALATASLGAQAPAPPSAAPGGEPGSELQVYVMTMGPGDQIWERFGHNALGIRDRSTATNVVYNWGVFRFTEADFLPRFLRGEMRYSVEPYDYFLTVAYYESINRSVEVQELDLTPAQKLAIREYVEWNARDENKFYRYDYFGDNCSTRVRDVLDKALGGALKRQFGTVPSGMSYRDEAKRLTETDLLYTGIDIGLGTPSDHPMTRWESMYIPMRLRDALREVKVAGPSGEVPVVASESTVFAAKRPAEPAAPAWHGIRYLLIGLVLALLIVVLADRAPRASRGIAGTWSVLSGIFGVLLVALWTLTRHVWAYRNVNLLLFHPLWIVIAVLVFRKSASGRTARWVILASAAAALVGTVLGLTNWPQAAQQVALLAMLPHAATLRTLWIRKAA